MHRVIKCVTLLQKFAILITKYITSLQISVIKNIVTKSQTSVISITKILDILLCANLYGNDVHFVINVTKFYEKNYIFLRYGAYIGFPNFVAYVIKE